MLPSLSMDYKRPRNSQGITINFSNFNELLFYFLCLFSFISASLNNRLHSIFAEELIKKAPYFSEGAFCKQFVFIFIERYSIKHLLFSSLYSPNPKSRRSGICDAVLVCIWFHLYLQIGFILFFLLFIFLKILRLSFFLE